MPEVGLLHDRRRDHRRPARRRPPAAPLCSTMMRSASSRTTSILCSTSRIGPVLACLQRADQVEDHRHLVDAHAGGRLVEHVDLRVQRHQQRHFELALVAVRQRWQRRRPCRPARTAVEDRAAPRRSRPGGRATRASRSMPWPRALLARLHRQAHVLQHREAAGTAGSAGTRGPGRARVRSGAGSAGDVVAVEQHAALRWPRSWPEIRLK